MIIKIKFKNKVVNEELEATLKMYLKMKSIQFLNKK